MISKDTFEFLKGLKNNNNKDWFEAHRKTYELAKTEVIDLVAEILKELSKADPALKEVDAKKSLFRINRDIRFSADKSPYKSNIGASFNAFGKKSMNAGYYIHIEPGKCFVGGGIHMPMPDVLAKMRQEIDYNFKQFESIIIQKDFKKYLGELSVYDALKNPPKGYTADNPAIEYLKYKSYVAGRNFTDKEVLSKDFANEIILSLKALKPLIDFINKGIS